MFRPPWRSKERIFLLTAYDRTYRQIADLTIPRMKAVSEAQSYDFTAVEATPPGRHPTWLKIAAIREALEKSFDWVLWVDADALFLRVDRDIREEIRGDVDLRMAWHVPLKKVTSDPPHFNNGVMLVRCCDWARQFLARVWDTGPVCDHWDEQATIMHLFGYDDILGLGPRKAGAFDTVRLGLLNVAWNTIPGLTACRDPIVHHYAGFEKIATRLRILRSDAGIPIERRKRRADRVRFAALLAQLRYHAKCADDIESSILTENGTPADDNSDR